MRLLHRALSGAVTVDNLDYVRRDAHFTGVQVGIDVERIYALTFGLGSALVGAAATIATAWITQKTLSKHELIRAEISSVVERFEPRVVLQDVLVSRDVEKALVTVTLEYVLVATRQQDIVRIILPEAR